MDVSAWLRSIGLIALLGRSALLNCPDRYPLTVEARTGRPRPALMNTDAELCLPPLRRLLDRLPGLVRVGLYDDPFEEYLHQQTRDKTWDVPVLAAMLDRHGGPVLDIGCGRGRISLALAARGATVRAVDSSEAVIARLQTDLATRSENLVTVVHGDVLDPGTGHGFAVIGDVAINMFTHPDQVITLLRRIRTALAHGGALALPVLTADGVSHYRNRNGVLADEYTDSTGSQHLVIGSMRFDPDGPYFSRTLFSQQNSPGAGPVHAHLACVRERLWTWSTLGPLTETAGLMLDGRHAAGPGQPSAEVLVLVPNPSHHTGTPPERSRG